MNQHHSKQAATESEGRTRILDAAYTLFVEHGFKAVSMQQIADAASITKATLYHHFLNKEALFTEVILLMFRHLRAEVATVIDDGGSLVDQLSRIACQSFARDDSDFGRLMTDAKENIASAEHHALIRERSFPHDLLRQIITGAIRSGELPEVDPDLVIGMYIGIIWGQVWVRKLDWVTGPLDEHLARTVVEILVDGLRHSPRTVAGPVMTTAVPA